MVPYENFQKTKKKMDSLRFELATPGLLDLAFTTELRSQKDFATKNKWSHQDKSPYRLSRLWGEKPLRLQGKMGATLATFTSSEF